MKKLFLLLALFLMCHLGMAQTNDSIWKPLRQNLQLPVPYFKEMGIG